MKKLMTIQELESLTRRFNGPAISLYLPTVQAGRETRQNAIRFKNLLNEAEERLRRQEIPENRLNGLLQPLRRIQQDALFWLHQWSGLVVFRADDFFRYYRLPITFPEMVMTNTRLYIKPLFRLLQGDGRYFLLALDLHGVRLFQGSRDMLEELEPVGLPPGLAEYIPPEKRNDRQQYHPGAGAIGGAPGAGSSQPAIFFGQSSNEDRRPKLILQYFREVNRALHELLRNERAPLLLVGLEELQGYFREANIYPNLLDAGLTVDPQALSREELHRSAWPVVKSQFDQERRRLVDLCGSLRKAGRVVTGLHAVLPAVGENRVDVLWVADKPVWGQFDRRNGRVETHPEEEPGDEDLLDMAAAGTLLQAGTVYVEEPDHMPGPASCQAILRW